jgi:hypothetical protein
MGGSSAGIEDEEVFELTTGFVGLCGCLFGRINLDRAVRGKVGVLELGRFFFLITLIRRNGMECRRW